MKKIIIIYTFIAGFAMSASAGVPGYMGHRFSLQYQFGISPQWDDFNSSTLPYLFHTVQAGYVVSRRHEIGMQYTRTDFTNNQFGSSISLSDGSSSIMDNKKYSGNNVMAYIKFFKPGRGFIAPLGAFIQFGIGYQYYNELAHVSPYESGTNGTGVPHYYRINSNDMYLGVGFGRNYIVADRLILNIEIDLNLPVTALARAFPITNLGDGTDTDVTSYLKKQNATDVLLNNIIHIKLGIGGLLF
jgi:hypothetical protein